MMWFIIGCMALITPAAHSCFEYISAGIRARTGHPKILKRVEEEETMQAEPKYPSSLLRRQRVVPNLQVGSSLMD